VPNSIAEDVETIGRIDVVPQILEVICRTTGMGFAAVARVTDGRWVACAVRDEIAFGLTPGGELELTTTICNEIRQSGEAVVIDHVAEDPQFVGHPTPALYGFQSYISIPIFHQGQFFGTLCAIDPRPAKLRTPEIVGMFALFANLIAQHLDTQERLAESEAALSDERRELDLREQFIAVLGHDLRNPLAAIQGASRLLLKTPLDDRALTMVGHVQASVGRMAGLIDNLMDFARARLGGGFEIAPRSQTALGATIAETIYEIQLAHPSRTIVDETAVDQPVNCDASRIAQLLSNLLGNAVAHGAPDTPVVVQASVDEGVFTLAVINRGDPIAPALQAQLFQPFSRALHATDKQGLGLGLYIAAEIARAHGGELSVTSDVAATAFTFRMPVQPG